MVVDRGPGSKGKVMSGEPGKGVPGRLSGISEASRGVCRHGIPDVLCGTCQGEATVELLPLTVRYDVADLAWITRHVERRPHWWQRDGRWWEVTQVRRIRLPGYSFRTCEGVGWRTYGDTIELFEGFRWDGASGPQFDTMDTWIPSLVHDIACSRVGGKPVLPGYMVRHGLYGKLCAAQGMARGRVAASVGALVVCNWGYELLKGRG